MGLEKTTLIPPLPSGPPRVAGAEPVAGYRLLEPLGSGGFGEVWKCEVPGGLFKAIKFVEGGGHGAAAPGSPAARELESLQRVKAIRHPFLLSTERVEVLDGVLTIVMELADKNLQDVLVEYQTAGQPGLPRDELLGYLAEAAEALDLLNFQHGLQHLDVKPHNLFVVSSHIKVGDFGLVHVCGEQRRGAGGTPLYAAPEILQNSLSRHSDQYSLAIVYQQLLTGSVPFWSPQAYNLVMQHLSGKPNLTSLPAHDQPIVAKALAKDPEHRFPSCLDFVQALLHASGSMAVPGSGLWRRPSGLRPAVKPADAVAPSSRVTNEVERTYIGTGSLAAITSNGNFDANGTAAPLRPTTAEQKTRLLAVDPPGEQPLLRSSAPGPTTSLLLPGFRFLTCLGQSPLVDLWTVQDPGGRERLAHCVLNHAKAGEDALDRLRALRHAALPTAEIFASPSGRVVLVSDLGRQTLRDRCEECQAQGLPGIPRQQLLAYLRVAAEALDQLRERKGLLHLGLNPGNILVEDEHVWLGDFGLIPLFWVPAGHSAAQLNARYAAPELVEPQLSSTADQYSLALIFTEMLTGIYPRAKGTSGSKSGLFRRPTLSEPRSGMTRRADGARSSRGSVKIDLDLLPADDRGIIARALSDDPSERFPSCTALIDVLEAATLGATPSEAVLTFSSLPLVVPFASLLGQPPPPGYVPPQLGPVITQLVTNATGNVTVLSFESVRYLLHRNGTWEYRCPIKLFTGLVKLKLEGFRQHWGARPIREEGANHVFRIAMGESTKRTFWQRGPETPPGLEIQLRLITTPGAPTQLREAIVRISPVGDLRDAQTHLRNLAPRILQSLRAFLQGIPEQRVDERWPFNQSLHVYPVMPDMELAGVLEARGRDLSRGGVRFLVPQRPETDYLYLHFRESPTLANLAILGRVVRAVEATDGWCDLGITFSVDGPSRIEQRSQWEYSR